MLSFTGFLLTTSTIAYNKNYDIYDHSLSLNYYKNCVMNIHPCQKQSRTSISAFLLMFVDIHYPTRFVYLHSKSGREQTSKIFKFLAFRLNFFQVTSRNLIFFDALGQKIGLRLKNLKKLKFLGPLEYALDTVA